MTKILLLQTVATLGKKGDIKDVAEGYARNYLFPKKLAVLATETAIKNANTAKEMYQKQEAERIEDKRGMALKIKSITLVLKRKEKSGKLFGSVSAKEIAAELKKHDLEISEKSIIIEEPIRKTGACEILVQIDKDIKEKLKLSVEPEN